MATDQLINKAQGDAIISGLTAIKNAINDQPVPTQVEDVVADAFDEGVSYVPGDYCIHENKLYICDVAHHGAWDGNDFTLTTVGAVLESLNNDLTQLTEFYTKDYPNTETVQNALNDFYTVIDKSKITPKSVLHLKTTEKDYYLNIAGTDIVNNALRYYFSCVLFDGSTVHNNLYTIRLSSNTSIWYKQDIYSTNQPVSVGTTSTVDAITIYYS